MNDKLKHQFYSEVEEYFRVELIWLKMGKKKDHQRLLQLSVTLPVTARRLIDEGNSKPKESTNQLSIDKLLHRTDLVNLLFTRYSDQQRHLSMSATNLIKRCDQLKIHHRVILELERERLIFRIKDTDHYQKI